MENEDKREKRLRRIAACSIAVGAGILPLIWVLFPITFDAKISISYSFSYVHDYSFGFIFTVISTGMAFALLLVAAGCLLMLKAPETRTFGSVFNLSVPVMWIAILILNIFVDSLTGLNNLDLVINIVNFILIVSTFVIYVQLFISYFKAWPDARKAERALLLISAAFCAFSLFYGILAVRYFFVPLQSGFWNFVYGNLAVRYFFIPLQSGFWNFDRSYDLSDPQLFISVTFAICIILRAVALLFPPRDKAAVKAASAPANVLRILSVFLGLAVVFASAFTTYSYIYRPYVDTKLAEDSLGMTFKEFSEMHKDDVFEFNLQPENISYYYFLNKYGSYENLYGFEGTPVKDDSVCASVYLEDAMDVFMNFYRTKLYSEICTEIFKVNEYSFDKVNDFAKIYGLTYIGMTMDNYGHTALPALVFQNKEYRILLSPKTYNLQSIEYSYLYDLTNLYAAITKKPAEDVLPIPEIKINTKEYLDSLPINSLPINLLACNVFNGLTETGALTPEQLARMYHLKIGDQVGNYILFIGKDTNYKIWLLYGTKNVTPIVTPFSHVELQ